MCVVDARTAMILKAFVVIISFFLAMILFIIIIFTFGICVGLHCLHSYMSTRIIYCCIYGTVLLYILRPNEKRHPASFVTVVRRK